MNAKLQCRRAVRPPARLRVHPAFVSVEGGGAGGGAGGAGAPFENSHRELSVRELRDLLQSSPRRVIDALDTIDVIADISEVIDNPRR